MMELLLEHSNEIIKNFINHITNLFSSIFIFCKQVNLSLEEINFFGVEQLAKNTPSSKFIILRC